MIDRDAARRCWNVPQTHTHVRTHARVHTQSFSFAFRAHERTRALASGMRDRRHRVDRQTAVNGRPRSLRWQEGREWSMRGAKRVVLQGETTTVLAEGVRKRRARERAAAGRRKPPARLDLSPRRVKPCQVLRRDKTCKRARSRSFRVETRRPFACRPHDAPATPLRPTTTGVIKIFQPGAPFVVSSICEPH